MKYEFVHLHNHSEYSLLDGLSSPKELAEAAKAMGCRAVALTDHGVVYGLVEFYRQAVRVGIKPILGAELYVAAKSRYERAGQMNRDPYHLLLLATDSVGYHNLINLSSRGHSEGFYYKPRVDLELLQRYSAGLIALSACASGEVARNILSSDLQGARKTAGIYDEIFGKGNFFLEMMDHGKDENRRINAELRLISRELDLPLVVSNDSHYLKPEDATAHDVMLCIQTGAKLHDKGRLRFPSQQFYLRSPQEMHALFADYPKALQNTVAIAERCNFDFNFDSFSLPEFPLPEEVRSKYHHLEDAAMAAAYLRDLVEAGLIRRYGSISSTARQRADYELSVITSMGFVGYFLIVWDFVRYAKEQGIDVGPGRGSATGSLVSYALGITKVDPLHYDLLFERFLNPERVSLPDIDIDFCFERRGEVISYVVQRYGSDKVAQIATFGTLGVRGAIRDVGKVLEIPAYEIDRIAKMVPYDIDQSVAKAISQSKTLQTEIAEKPPIKELFRLAAQVEGKPRNVSMHAAGVVIPPKPLLETLPLLSPISSSAEEGLGGNLTQYAMYDLEALGFLKIDFLGLRTLTLLRQASLMVQKEYGVTIEPDAIPLDDAKTYALLANGDTEGLFQFESSGMRRVLRSLKPDCIEDIIAAVALYRPGPMEHIPEFIAAKQGKTPVSYLHPRMRDILASTYGVVVYQEQVMRIASEIAGFTLGEADLIRRAMSKRDPELLKELKDRFVSGAVFAGVEQQTAERVFEIIRPFGSYGFNKSHAAAYGILAYKTAWFKAHYPLQYTAALLSSYQGSQEQVARYIGRFKSKGMRFLPPDINRSEEQFIVEGQSIRFGLLGIKNMGRPTISAILTERASGEFPSLNNFIRRLGSVVSKRHVESLLHAGAFDKLGERAWHLMVLPELQERVGQVIHMEKR